ncbi:MAG: GH25 family lysozyme [Lachnospiraceae bacterium]|nr:GH25 family lysozyme [Lachnospiraceae bacterium]
MTPESKPLIHGIDVSHWSGNIDFHRVKEDGIEIVYIKSSEGQSLIDPHFEINYRKAKEHNLKIGFYHYVTARSKAQAKAEAEFFLSLIREKDYDCHPVMDFESFFDLDRRKINRIAKEFMETCERESGHRPMIYSDASNASAIFDRYFSRYPLWIAQYGVKEPAGNGKWLHWTGWQYTSSGRVDGIDGDTDRDYFTKEVYLTRRT